MMSMMSASCVDFSLPVGFKNKLSCHQSGQSLSPPLKLERERGRRPTINPRILQHFVPLRLTTTTITTTGMFRILDP